MQTIINLEGEWNLQLGGSSSCNGSCSDTIVLPGTTSSAQKGQRNEEKRVGSLTDPYLFEGYAWYSKEVELPPELATKTCFLFLERTRKTTVWIGAQKIGSRDSLSTPHLYELTGMLRTGRQQITVLVDNTGYSTKGGHLTSPDTQTNWNGITGRIELQFYGEAYWQDIQIYPDLDSHSVRVEARWSGKGAAAVTLSAAPWSCEAKPGRPEEQLPAVSTGIHSTSVSLDYPLGKDALLWSEAHPHLYQLTLHLWNAEGTVMDSEQVVFGLREFQTNGDKFTINGTKTFLRGKHDGLVFPLTGYAPTDVEEWLRILSISQSYGINHYRFHTCCPPDAAFTAADILGMYMEPELPFWGTVTEEGDENQNQAEQDYLIREGFAMLDAYGNHPSFVMMSLGNELWGSRSRINAILQNYKSYDRRHLYTQGSNNHQFAPAILEHDDFFCGVRFSRERLIRGSYATCDAPLGHVQTDRPSTQTDYDAHIAPSQHQARDNCDRESRGTVRQIQFGTGTRTVELDDPGREWIPHIPVISHEIGQYAMYPDYAEIAKYKGALKAENLKLFQQRLAAQGLEHMAPLYFDCSGHLAVACYKEELEAAFRSRRLAGFQLLDLQDFPGQGTALVGVLDAFMDSKGLITPEEWRTFCNDAVLLARFDRYNCRGGEQFAAHVELVWYRSGQPESVELEWELTAGPEILDAGVVHRQFPPGEHYLDICDLHIDLPLVEGMTPSLLSLRIAGTDIRKTYELWLYPQEIKLEWTGIHRFEELTPKVLQLLDQGENVLLMPKPDRLKQAVEGFYCTDFWNYPMFRSISESVNKPAPVGTMGLVIDNSHPVFRSFPCERYSTYPWWSMISHSASIIMDKASPEWQPIVQTIDNVERNHKLGFLLECRIGAGKLLICPLDADKAAATPEGRQFLMSLAHYVQSAEFKPAYAVSVSELLSLLQS